MGAFGGAARGKGRLLTTPLAPHGWILETCRSCVSLWALMSGRHRHQNRAGSLRIILADVTSETLCVCVWFHCRMNEQTLDALASSNCFLSF